MFKKENVVPFVFGTLLFIIAVLIFWGVGLLIKPDLVARAESRDEQAIIERKQETLALSDVEIEAIGFIRDGSYIIFRIVDGENILYIVTPSFGRETPAVVSIN